MNSDQDMAVAMPTKQFFVSMLTRDISLEDAILDLVDNCLDGALRVSDTNEVDYSQHWVRIKLSKNSFVIEDNCGGIPREIAKNYAFKMGREPDDDRDSENETIGMYGVGMKRAIFKMGRESIVITRHNNDAFEVPISSAWLDDKDWKPLPIIDASDNKVLDTPGTRIVVKALTSGVSRHFSNNGFLNDLINSISEHFTMFLQKGFSILVNGISVKPVFVEVLVSKEENGPAPYIYEGKIDGVTVSITVGLNTARGLSLDDDEIPEFERDRSSRTAGWTVFCNDRAVIVGDKSRLTGWGVLLPRHHFQYSIITGIVEFRSNKAENLPITTTKRALDVSSNVWLQSLNKMREGMRIWINYTNAWKNHPRADQTKYWKDTKSLPLRSVIKLISKRETVVKKKNSLEFNPKKHEAIPYPETHRPTSRRIVFSRPIDEIRFISKTLFDSEDQKPSEVGETCFEIVLKKLKNEEVVCE